MVKYIFVILENNSQSFCYYKYSKKKSSKIIPIKTLTNLIKFSKEKELGISYLFGTTPLSDDYKKIIESTPHTKFYPLELNDKYSDGILIINSNKLEKINKLEKSSTKNIILRVEKEDLEKLYEITDLLFGKYKRLNISLLDIDKYEDSDINTYKNFLSKTAKFLIEEYKSGNGLELGFLSDRIFLNKMNNCNAGLDHITFSPNGKFYICPGFYYENEKNNIGNIENGIKLDQKSKLLKLKNAPICSLCDAFQCKRCVYLNKKITQELNTPSYQQCILSHHERNTSKYILDSLHKTKNFHDFNQIKPIQQIDYIDPFDIITGEKSNNKIIPDTITIKNNGKTITLPKLKKVDPRNYNINKKNNIIQNNQNLYNTNKSKLNNNSITKKIDNEENLENLSIKDLLIKIYQTQKKILKEFNK